MQTAPQSASGRAIDAIEETFIAVTLGLMTVVTFANVIARYVFATNILWALETTVFLFAWLVLIGASYCVKKRAHLGVDVLILALPRPVRLTLAGLSIVICLVFSVLLLMGAWNYWAPFAGLPNLQGVTRDQAWYEVNDIPMLDFLRFIEPGMNAGEAYEKLPRFIPYTALPLGMALLTFRFLQAGWRVATGEWDRIMASHEAEDLVESVSAQTKED